MKKCGVYKYVYNNEIIYVGKSDHSILGRIKGHSIESKFKPFLKKCQIYYAWLPNPAFTTIFEIFLINKYKPRLNVAMKYDTILPFDICEPVWHLFTPSIGLLYQKGDELNFTNSNNDELFNLRKKINVLEATINVLNDRIIDAKNDKEYWCKKADEYYNWYNREVDKLNHQFDVTHMVLQQNSDCLEKYLTTKKALSNIQDKFNDLFAKYKQAQLDIESKNNIIDSMNRKSELKRKFKSFFHLQEHNVSL